MLLPHVLEQLRATFSMVCMRWSRFGWMKIILAYYQSQFSVDWSTWKNWTWTPIGKPRKNRKFIFLTHVSVVVFAPSSLAPFKTWRTWNICTWTQTASNTLLHQHSTAWPNLNILVFRKIIWRLLTRSVKSSNYSKFNIVLRVLLVNWWILIIWTWVKMPNWRIHLLSVSRQPAAPGKPSTWPVNHTPNTPLNIPNWWVASSASVKHY